MNLLQSLPDKREFERFVRFALVGVIGTGVDMALLVVLKQGLGLPLLLANSLSYSAGIVNNFLLNRYWTYAGIRSKSGWGQAGQFTAVSLMGLVLNTALVGLFSSMMSATDDHTIIAKIAATVIVLFWNFFVNRVWTFKEAPESAGSIAS